MFSLVEGLGLLIVVDLVLVLVLLLLVPAPVFPTRRAGVVPVRKRRFKSLLGVCVSRGGVKDRCCFCCGPSRVPVGAMMEEHETKRRNEERRDPVVHPRGSALHKCLRTVSNGYRNCSHLYLYEWPGVVTSASPSTPPGSRGRMHMHHMHTVLYIHIPVHTYILLNIHTYV